MGTAVMPALPVPSAPGASLQRRLVAQRMVQRQARALWYDGSNDAACQIGRFWKQQMLVVRLKGICVQKTP